MGLFSRNNKIEKPEVLLELRSPSCPITAVVEQDNRTAYFYLFGDNEDFGMKSCWIRNLIEAPEKIETKLMEKGVPPMLTKEFCKFPKGQEALNADNLEIVWLEEGDGAALLENGEILCVIPSWGGDGGFYGYARDCIGTGDFAWELSEDNEMRKRVKSAIKFFEAWEKFVNPFQLVQPEILKYYDEMFGKSEKYFAIDGPEGPPKGLYVLEGNEKTVFATVAVSLRPQPKVEMYYENPDEVNRIELGVILKSGLTNEQVNDVAGLISGIAMIPWDYITFLAEGHTVEFQTSISEKFKYAVLTNKLKVLPQINLTSYAKSNVSFLLIVPISEREMEVMKESGSQAVLSKLDSIGEEIFNLERNEVV
ncbi:suppressor of fused domain protein [Flavobacterium tyrosinilyticum]|uniref:suppressor of fused domain protein n=1 Tax=Flavobacterium tyrosinilyticum TaxID=1658740 RepID=UPI00202EB5A8|nr:suppressor of fused domain protein [Flavobacterium tyrosinilyticum]MCM0665625.1 suppressor of fused domain protein [Flavobacterium tyrosinilyticum]